MSVLQKILKIGLKYVVAPYKDVSFELLFLNLQMFSMVTANI